MFAATDVQWRTVNASLVASRAHDATDLPSGCGKQVGGRAPYCVRRDSMVAGTVARAGKHPAPTRDRFDASRNSNRRGNAIECETSSCRPSLRRSSYVVTVAQVAPSPAPEHYADPPQGPSDLRHCVGSSPSLRAPPVDA
jgi:hypothetical protein